MRWAVRVATLALVVLAALMRLPHLATNPGWDGDEGYNYNIALNLAHGRHQMFALDFAFVQHPPLFFALAAGLFRLMGPSMLALRLVSIAFALGTMILLVPLGQVVGQSAAFARDGSAGARIGLLAALAYAVLPFVALQNRFGYTYNGLAFWTALTLLAVLRTRRDRPGWAVLAGLATAAALATDQEAAYLLPLLALGLRGRSVMRRLGMLLLALSGPALYLGAMALSDRAALIFDITHTAGRVTGGSAAVQAIQWLYNLADLMRMDPSIPLGLAGLALIPLRIHRRRVLGLLVLMLLVILKVRDPNPLFRTAEPLLPLVCLGLGLLGTRLWATIEAAAGRVTAPRARLLAALAMALLLGPLGAAGVRFDVVAANTRYHTAIDGLLPRSTAQAAALGAWLNRHAQRDDVVLAMPQVSWLVDARTAELLQAVAITGQGSAFYPAGIAPRRWVYDVHLRAARFLVVDAFTRAWIAASPGERALVQQARRAWRLVYHRGEYQVYENPARMAAPLVARQTTFGRVHLGPQASCRPTLAGWKPAVPGGTTCSSVNTRLDRPLAPVQAHKSHWSIGL